MGGRTHGKNTEIVMNEIKQYHPTLLFDRFNYVNCNTKVTLGCQQHGYFEKYPNDIKKGRGGCPICNKSFHKNHDYFVKELSILFPNIQLIDVYKNAKTNLRFHCLKHNISFHTTPNQIMSGHCRCPECTAERSVTTKLKKSKSVVDPALKSDYEIYKQTVWRHSNRNYKKYMSAQKRDRYNHLDHIVSILEGFKYNIPPEIIGSVHNLQIIDGKKNRQKSYRSDISPIKLMERYNNA